jgi:anti-sigma B factor antagonist
VVFDPMQTLPVSGTLSMVKGGSVPFRGDFAMTQQGAPRRESPKPAAITPERFRADLSAAPHACAYAVGGYTVVELHGEIDIVGRECVGLELDRATSPPAPAVVIDLTPTCFFDCSGLELLCRAYRRVRDRGGRLRVVCDSPLILRTLRVGGLLEVVSPAPTLAEALREG